MAERMDISLKKGLDRMTLLNTFLLHYLERFDAYCFLVTLDGQTKKIGEGEPAFEIIVHKSIPKMELLKSTELAFGEAFMRGDVEIKGDLFQAMCCFLGQQQHFAIDLKAINKLLWAPQTKKAQKEQVSSHYDLGNDFYSLWLDPSMSYSCAYFKESDYTLEQAQKAKVHYILKKLYLEKGQTLLDIGCGWGYLLIEAAKTYGVKGVGVTLSEEQWKKGQERIRAEHLEDLVDIKLLDYRDLNPDTYAFDRIVSVGMLEHVGRSNYEVYMKQASMLLKDGGLFLLHFISGHQEGLDDPWIRKYIFPGGMIPSLREIISVAYDTEFQVRDVESLRRHYEKTLLCWYDNFKKVEDKVRAERGDEFVRMWTLYLVGCAAAFHVGNINLHQILMTKGTNNELPLTRWY